MKTIIDSSVWSNFFRKKSRNETDERIARKIQKLAVNNEIVIIDVRPLNAMRAASVEKSCRRNVIVRGYWKIWVF